MTLNLTLRWCNTKSRPLHLVFNQNQVGYLMSTLHKWDKRLETVDNVIENLEDQLYIEICSFIYCCHHKWFDDCFIVFNSISFPSKCTVYSRTQWQFDHKSVQRNHQHHSAPSRLTLLLLPHRDRCLIRTNGTLHRSSSGDGPCRLPSRITWWPTSRFCTFTHGTPAAANAGLQRATGMPQRSGPVPCAVQCTAWSCYRHGESCISPFSLLARAIFHPGNGLSHAGNRQRRVGYLVVFLLHKIEGHFIF